MKIAIMKFKSCKNRSKCLKLKKCNQDCLRSKKESQAHTGTQRFKASPWQKMSAKESVSVLHPKNANHSTTSKTQVSAAFQILKLTTKTSQRWILQDISILNDWTLRQKNFLWLNLFQLKFSNKFKTLSFLTHILRFLDNTVPGRRPSVSSFVWKTSLLSAWLSFTTQKRRLVNFSKV